MHMHVHKGLRQVVNIYYMYIKSYFFNTYIIVTKLAIVTQQHKHIHVSEWVAMDYMPHEYSTAVAVLD